MSIHALVDAFVQKVNSDPKEEAPPDINLSENDAYWSQFDPTDWEIVRFDNAARIEKLQQRIGRRFPPSFLDFVSRYSFPAFEYGPLLFYGNKVEETYWDLSRKLFADPIMSPLLLRAGFIQIGNPFFANYDPICFDCNQSSDESPLVQLDHEAILCHSKVEVAERIASSFIELLNSIVNKEPDAGGENRPF